jgi:cytochrome c-type biogenesis protein
MSENMSFFIAFVAGLTSFFSPCVIPLIPAYISFITGLSLEELKETRQIQNTQRIIINIILFILGFSSIFIILGIVANSLGTLIIKNQHILKIIGGIIIILLGLHILGLFKLKFLEYEHKINIRTKGLYYVGSFIVGITFALAWTPCVGPILAVILTLAATQETLSNGIFLLAWYSLGLGIPFLISGILINKLLNFIRNAGRLIRIINIITGIFLIIIGLLLIMKGELLK